MHAGGFDVIIGNPPYVETSKVQDVPMFSDFGRVIVETYTHSVWSVLLTSCLERVVFRSLSPLEAFQRLVCSLIKTL